MPWLYLMHFYHLQGNMYSKWKFRPKGAVWFLVLAQLMGSSLEQLCHLTSHHLDKGSNTFPPVPTQRQLAPLSVLHQSPPPRANTHALYLPELVCNCRYIRQGLSLSLSSIIYMKVWRRQSGRKQQAQRHNSLKPRHAHGLEWCGKNCS